MYSARKIPAPFQEEARELTPAPLEAKEKCTGLRKKEPRMKNSFGFFVALLVLLCCCN